MTSFKQNKKRLFHERLAIIRNSKANPIQKIAASNSITILNHFHFPFSGLNLKGVHIPYADLTKAICHHTNFKKANFQNAILIQAQFVKAKLVQANLSNVTFGQRPTLQFKKGFHCIALHPSEDKCAVHLHSKETEIWDSDQKKLLYTFDKRGNPPLMEVLFSQNGEVLAELNKAGYARFCNLVQKKL